jgi:hypothetical protein
MFSDRRTDVLRSISRFLIFFLSDSYFPIRSLSEFIVVCYFPVVFLDRQSQDLMMDVGSRMF